MGGSDGLAQPANIVVPAQLLLRLLLLSFMLLRLLLLTVQLLLLLLLPPLPVQLLL